VDVPCVGGRTKSETGERQDCKGSHRTRIRRRSGSRQPGGAARL